MTPPAVTAPLLRAMARSPVPAAAVVAAAPALVALARGHRDLATGTTFLVVAGAATLGLAVDDPAAATLDACAIPRGARRVARAALVALVVVAATAVVVAAADATGTPLGPMRDRVPEAVAAAALSVALAARAARDGVPHPGLPAAATTVLAMATATGLSGASAHLAWLPQVGNPGHVVRWWTIAAVAGGCAWHWSRDPGAPRMPSGVTRRPRGHRASARRRAAPAPAPPSRHRCAGGAGPGGRPGGTSASAAGRRGR